MDRNVHRNSRGESLVQVMVAIAIAGIVMAAMTTMLTHLANENRALGEKIGANDLARAITADLSGPNCSLLFGASNVLAGSLTFDPAAVSVKNPQYISLKAIPASAGAPPVAIAGETASSYSTTLAILGGTGIQVAITGPSSANLIVNFDQNALVRGIHNLSLPITLSTSAGSTITGCLSSTSADAMCVALEGIWNFQTSKCDISANICSIAGGTVNPDGTCSTGTCKAQTSGAGCGSCTNSEGIVRPATCVCGGGGWVGVCTSGYGQ